jgi:hypothetical protein
VGEDHGQDTGRDTRRRLSVPEAADALGVTVDAIRSRVKRGTIAHVREGGRVYVLLGTDQGRPGHDQDTDQYVESDALISQMQARIDSLERELDVRTEEIRRRDTIIMNMTEAMKALSPPASSQEPSEARESPESAEEEQGRGSVPPTEDRPVERRPWWRRVFGGGPG